LPIIDKGRMGTISGVGLFNLPTNRPRSIVSLDLSQTTSYSMRITLNIANSEKYNSNINLIDELKELAKIIARTNAIISNPDIAITYKEAKRMARETNAIEVVNATMTGQATTDPETLREINIYMPDIQFLTNKEPSNIEQNIVYRFWEFNGIKLIEMAKTELEMSYYSPRRNGWIFFVLENNAKLRKSIIGH